MNDFLMQFRNKKTIIINNRPILFVDVIPPLLKYEIPIFIAPGWGESPRTFKDLIGLLYSNGFRVISVTHPRQDLKLITRNNISKFEYQKAEIILSIFRFLKLKKINIIAHSEGCINVVIAAHTDPNFFNNILLVCPGGFVKNENFIELLSRFISNFIQEKIRVFSNFTRVLSLVRSGIETLEYFIKNPIMGLLEGSAISKTHLQQFLVDLHKNNIEVGIIYSINDLVFPFEKIEDLSGFKWVNLISVDGGHSDIYENPENYVAIVLRKFNTFQRESGNLSALDEAH